MPDSYPSVVKTGSESGHSSGHSIYGRRRGPWRVKEKEKKAEKDDAESKYEAGKEEAKKQYEAKDDGDAAEETDGQGHQVRSVPGRQDLPRLALFTFLATFLTAFLFADPIPNGLRVEFDLLASLKLVLISGVIAAVLRAVAGMLPVFADDSLSRARAASRTPPSTSR